MTAVIPSVHVYIKKTQLINRPGMAGKVAVVGAFNTEATDPILCESVDSAYTQLGDDTSFKGCACIDKLFVGASSILAVNITEWTGSGEKKTADKELTTNKLSQALAKIKGEDWDILFVAENITDEALVIIDAYLSQTFEMKYPAGFVAGLTRADATAYITTASKCGEHCYGVLTQQLKVNNTLLSIEESGAYYCGLIAGMNVGNTFTMKQLTGVNGLGSELSFETDGDGKALVEAGITTVKCQDRRNERYIVVNSEQPNGYDLYINRVRDYVIKEFSLHQFLGERNTPATLNEIKQEIDRVKNVCVNTLDLLQDIQYTVTKKDVNCVDIHVDSLVFAGLITEIDTYIKIEVE